MGLISVKVHRVKIGAEATCCRLQTLIDHEKISRDSDSANVDLDSRVE